MSYIFFDLEWNQGYPRSPEERLDEIIQIGACRLDSWEGEGVPFSAYVRPSIHRSLHHRVKKILPLNQKELRRAEPFRKVIRDFFRWCGPDPVFFTWGDCDARVLDMNLCWYGMEEFLDVEIYDLQRAYDLCIAHTDQQAALKDAVEHFGLEDQLEYHDAGNDAFYTAMIGAEMVRRLSALPTEEELRRGEERFRQEKRRRARQEAIEALEQALGAGEPFHKRSLGPAASVEDILKSRSARIFPCPECGNGVCSGNWYQVGKRYVARGRCSEHGRCCSCVTIRREEKGFAGELLVFDGANFPQEAFQHCKRGGECIVVGKTPRKRRRRRVKAHA
jgi:inhibitor of KinA sporulation pathway (predicted exonuclease)